MAEGMFWDKKISKEEVKSILQDEFNTRFVYFAAILLSRTSNIKEVFAEYLDKVMFCRNWRKIKREMRKNKWSDQRIYFWDEVYKVTLQKIDIRKRKIPTGRDISINPDLKEIGRMIRSARKKLGWTQTQLAKNIDLSQQTISLIESGKFSFSFGSLRKILKALNLKFSIESQEGYPDSVTTSSECSTPFININTRE